MRLLFSITLTLLIINSGSLSQRACPTKQLTAYPTDESTRTYINSPLYPKYYENRIDCWWLIRSSDPNQRVKLTVFDFMTESCCDKLWIFNSSTSGITDKRLATNVLSGSISELHTIVSSTDSLAVNFVTNGDTSLRGFRIAYEATDDPVTDAMEIPDDELEASFSTATSAIIDLDQFTSIAKTSCSFGSLNATDSLQAFTSPGFPRSYSSDLDCEWSVRSKEVGQVVQLSFESMDLEPCCDNLVVTDGGEVIGVFPQRASSLASADKKTFVSSTSEGFVVSMKSDGSVERGGFQALYRSVSAMEPNKLLSTSGGVCFQSVVASDEPFLVSSPGWPRNYRSDLNCLWNITAADDNHIVKITILEADLDGCCDYLEVSENSGYYKRFYEANEKIEIESKSTHVQLVFSSDSSLFGKGFQASITQVERQNNDLYLDDEGDDFQNIESTDSDVERSYCPLRASPNMCVRMPSWSERRATYECDFTTVADDEAASLDSPGFPLDYGADERCLWRIKAPEGFLVQLTIGNFESESCCDSLKIWGTKEMEVELAGKLRGDRSFVSANRSGLVVAFRSDATIHRSGFRGLFRRVPADQIVEPLRIQPSCSYEIKVGTTEQVINTPGWPDKYPNNLDCYWNLTSQSAGKEIELTIYNFTTEACCDFLQVSGESVSTKIKGGLQKTRRILSSGNYLNLHFASDRSVAEAGFTATLRLVDAESNKISPSGIQQNFVGSKSEITATSEAVNLTSPNFPMPYDPDMDHIWIISPENDDSLVKVVIEELVTESCCDFLDVFIIENDGYDRIRGEISTARHFTGKSIMLRFFSDSTDQRKGFRASYASINLKNEKFNETRLTKKPSNQYCGSVVVLNATQTPQIFTSPGWPNEYENDLDCYWTIQTSDKNKVVELTSRIINTEACCDYLEVEGGNETLRFKGYTEETTVVLSSGNQLALKFVSDSNRKGQGFKMEYREVNRSNDKISIPVSGKNNCTYTLEADEKIKEVTTKNFPDSYDPNIDCVWIIQASSTQTNVRLTIEEAYTEECCDYAEIYTANNVYERIKGTLSLAKTYEAPYVVVRFFSDGSMQHRGLRFTYKTVDDGANATDENPGQKVGTCQKTLVADDSVKEIVSQEMLIYAGETNCTWTIVAPEKQTITLNFTFFETEECCDFVEVIEENQQKAKLSGSINFYSISSSTNRLLIKFTSDASINMQGFTARFKAVVPKVVEVIGKEERVFVDDLQTTTEAPVLEPVTTTALIDEDKMTSLGPIIFQPCDETRLVTMSPLSFASPNYPNSYDSNLECDTVFEAVHGRRMLITFHDVSMETCCDSIDILDEPSGERIAKLNMEKVHSNLTYVTTSHRVALKMRTDGDVSGEGYLATIQAMPVDDCYTTIVLDSNKPVRVMSRNFPKNYPNQNCTWKIINSNATRQIRISFTHLSIEECCDTVQLYDGYDEREMIILPKGSDEDVYETTTSVLTIKMIVDKSVTKRGFDALVESFEEHYDVFDRKGCGSTVIVGDTEEILLSPNYPEVFGNKMNCHWLYRAKDPLKILSFFFDEIEINDCCSEIKIYDGPGVNYPLLTTISKYNIPENFLYSTSNSVYIVLESAEEFAFGIFFASFFQDVVDRNECNVKLPVIDVLTPLVSKGYPLTYSHQANCTWTLMAEEGKRVELVIEDIDMETCCDYVEVSDGQERRLIERVSSMGEKKRLLFRSTTSQMNVRLFSDRSIGGRGFTAHFTLVQDYFDPQACGYTVYVGEDDVMHLTTPNYPNNYPSNADCHWLLVAKEPGEQVRFRIDDARLEECCDSVQIRDGFSNDDEVVGIIKDYVGPEGRLFTSTKGALHIRFQSDISGSFHGFHGHYSLGGKPTEYSHVCSKIELLESDDINIRNTFIEDCDHEAKCLKISASDVDVTLNDFGRSTRGYVEYGACIPANECESLTCDYISQVEFEKHNVSLKIPSNCNVSCCSGDLCNSGSKSSETKIEPSEAAVCKGGKLDIMFLMDGSGSLTDLEFELQKLFIDEISSKFDFNKVHIGIMQYSHWFKWSPLTSEAQIYFETHISLGNYSNHHEFSEALSIVQPHGYTAYVGHAVEKAILEDMTKSRRFLDRCTKKAMVVLIDGKASDGRYLKASHRQAKAFNIQMFGIGVDQYRRPELQVLVNGKRGVNDRIFTARSFSKLNGLVDQLYTALYQLF